MYNLNSNPANEPTSLLSRSKSYDTKLNLASESLIYSGMFSMFNPDNLKKPDESAKITITSFAPNPKEIRSNCYGESRPSSQSLYSQSNANNSDSQANSKYENQNLNNRNLSVIWSNGKNTLPMIFFRAKVLRKNFWECKKVGETYRLTFKFLHGERKLVKALLEGHGFREVHPNNSEFNLIWSGNNLKSYLFRSLQENQKVNHFPRSCELTRKDRLYKNIQRMQREKGQKAFNIVPTTFILPYEIDDFYTTFYKEKGIWIVKPACLSRGRGIYLISHPDQIPLDENLVVSKYLSNPLLIEGFKFDLRLYVAVTSFDPLVFYMYEEGLTRFATVKYDQNVRNIRNTCMHLTNYSLNKKNEKYVKCNDPDLENYGNKWSMSALLRYLNSLGKDTFALMMNIEEVLIKTLLAVESPMASAARMFMPHRGNCFELYGFDILIDEQFKPWVLEVNLSPSLDCDALLDIRIKSNMLADLLTLSGIYCQNPFTFSNRYKQKETKSKNENKIKLRPHSASMNAQGAKSATSRPNYNDSMYNGLNPTEQNILKVIIEENQRANGWIRIFPTSDTWEFYSHYLETRTTSYNIMLHKKLFPRRWINGTIPKKSTLSRAKALENQYEMFRFNNYVSTENIGASFSEAFDRYKRYERKLDDQVRPNEDTLRKLSNAPFKIQPVTAIKTNFSLFPNGERSLNREKDNSLSSDLLNDNECLSDSTSDIPKYKSDLSDGKKRLPTITKSRPTRVNNLISKNDSKKKNINNIQNCNNENSNDENSECEDNSYLNDSKQNDLENSQEIIYKLSTVLKHLENGYFLSRIQIRIAFALYLFKIQVRLFNESQSKDESNVQQMDLVLRFIKKASPNLTQEFKVYVPSKRLPICEQKRMLSKQLHDFLHIYKRDTELTRMEMNTQIEKERKKKRNKVIDDKAFQALLYKSSESDLEEIMSAYMKYSHDSSIFLGSSKNSGFDKKNLDLAKTETRNLIEFKMRSPSENTENKLEDHKDDQDGATKTTNDEEMSQRSFDSRSDFSKSSDDEVQSRSRSSSPVLDKAREKSKKNLNINHVKENKSQKNKNSVNSKSSNRLFHLDSSISSWKKDKPKINKALDYHNGISNIYLQAKNRIIKNRPKTIQTLKSTSAKTKTFHNSSASLAPANKLTPLTVNSQINIQNSNQSNFISPLSISSKDQQASPLNTLRKVSNVYIHKPHSNNNNFTNNDEGRKKLESNTNRSLLSNSQILGFDDASVLSMGLKNLHLKQQERQYSGVKSLRLIATVDDANSSHPNVESATSYDKIKEKKSSGKSFVSAPVIKDNYTFRDFLNEKNVASPSENINTEEKRNLTLIERLEKQKETSNLVLEKSRLKHNQMMAANQAIYENKTQNQSDNLKIYFSTIKN